MSLYRIGVLVAKEFRHGAGNLFFILAIVYPIVLSLIISLLFGDLVDQKPRLGIVDEGRSAVTVALAGEQQLDVRVYNDVSTLRADTEKGVVAVGIVIPAGFDEALTSGGETDLTRYVWAEALQSDEIVIESALHRTFFTLSGADLPLALEINQLGEADVATWSQRLMPILIILTIMLGGIVLPASALVDEKSNRTLLALTVTPATLLEVYVSKAVIGIVISIAMGAVVLFINNAFGSNPALLLSLLALSAVTASVFGVIVGTLVDSINGLLAAIKGIGFVLALPGILAIFPEVPMWIQQVFPSYYIMHPVMEVSQHNATFADIGVEVGILLVITGLMIVYLVTVFERQQKKLALAG